MRILADLGVCTLQVAAVRLLEKKSQWNGIVAAAACRGDGRILASLAIPGAQSATFQIPRFDIEELGTMANFYAEQVGIFLRGFLEIYMLPRGFFPGFCWGI